MESQPPSSQDSSKTNAWQKLPNQYWNLFVSKSVNPACIVIYFRGYPLRWASQLQIGRDSCPALAGGDQDQAVLQCWPAQLRQLWWKALSCPPGHPTMCCGSGAQLCWLEKASAHLTKLEKRFSSKWLLVKLWHSMWTIRNSVTSPMLVCLLLWFKKRKNKLCRKNGSRDIDSLMDGNPTVCLDHV